MKKKWLIVIGLIIAFIVILGVTFSGKIAHKVAKLESYYVKIFHRTITQGLTEGFKKTADKLNARGPVMLNKNVRWDKTVAGPGPRITYFYTLVNLSSNNIDRDKLNSNLNKNVGKSVCNSPKIKPSIDLGANYAYVYDGNDGVEVARLEINSQTCGFTTH